MSRVYIASKSKSIPSKRVDNRKYENRNSFMGSNRERNRQVCNRNVRNHFPWECGAQSCRETCCQSETTTEVYRDTVFHFYPSAWKEMDPSAWKEMDRGQSWVFSSRLFCGFKSPWSDCCDMTNQSLEKMMEQYDLTISWKNSRKSSMVLCIGQLRLDISFLVKGGGPKKRFQYCSNPNSSKRFLYFRAIQWHSGGDIVDLEFQDNVLLPEGTSGIKVKCIQELEVDWSREEEVSKTGKTICVLHWSAPDGRWSWYGGDCMRPEQSKNHSTQKILGNLIKIVYCCNLKLAQKRGLQFYQTRSHAIVLYNTLLAVCIEKLVCVKTKEELYHKVYLTPGLPRVVLKANSHNGQQDQQEQDARTSCDRPSGSQGSGETWCNNVDCRIPGIPLSAVEQQDTNRKDKVKRLIQQFDSHPNKESFLQDLHQTEKTNEFSEKSQKLIADINNTEIFELCETSSKKQCPDTNFYCEIGIVYCTCGRCLKPSQRTKEYDKNNYDVLSIPGYVIKKKK